VSPPGERRRLSWGRLHWFLTERIWAARLDELGRGRALAYRVVRILTAIVRGFFENTLTVRAAALTYYTALSIVPFLAFAFAVLKGLGAYRMFMEGTARPYLARTFGENPTLLDALRQILGFVDRANVSALGVLGLLILVYTSVGLLSSVEQALNQVWGARTRRPLLRQLTEYVTLLVVAPLLVAVIATSATAAHSAGAAVALRGAPVVGPLLQLLPRITSLAVVAAAFFAIYTILPNVPVRKSSALLGAVVAAVLWQGALVLYVQFQLGVAGYSALYSVLGAVPIFLVWTYVSWIILLIGASVAAAHQNERSLAQRFRAARVDPSLRETVAVAVAALVARSFVGGGPRPSAHALAERLDVPAPVVQEILDAMVRAGLIARTAPDGEPWYVPARDVDAIRVVDVEDALRRDALADPLREAVERRAGPELRQLLAQARDEWRGSRWNLTLRELAALVPERRADA
jgi:membrane protein